MTVSWTPPRLTVRQQGSLVASIAKTADPAHHEMRQPRRRQPTTRISTPPPTTTCDNTGAGNQQLASRRHPNHDMRQHRRRQPTSHISNRQRVTLINTACDSSPPRRPGCSSGGNPEPAQPAEGRQHRPLAGGEQFTPRRSRFQQLIHATWSSTHLLVTRSTRPNRTTTN
jgi:hypothetical protein